MSLRRLMAVMQKEVRQMRRDRITLAMIVAIPVMQLLLFGYAINTNLRDLKAGVADQANTAASRALFSRGSLSSSSTGSRPFVSSAAYRRSSPKFL